MVAGKKNKDEELGENDEKGENFITNGEKGLKNASFWVIN